MKWSNMKDPKELPLEDQPDHKHDALLKKLGLVHIGEVIQSDGEIVLLRDQAIAELRKALLAQDNRLTGKSSEEIEAILTPICREHANRFEERAMAVMRDYHGENKKESSS